MGSGGACRIQVNDIGKKAISVTISDAGKGVAPEVLRQVFRPFFTTKPQGLGLGLPLARRIVERFGGTMQLDSSIGTGTTVTIQFPRD
jgi:signal transduction histidine kinase